MAELVIKRNIFRLNRDLIYLVRTEIRDKHGSVSVSDADFCIAFEHAHTGKRRLDIHHSKTVIDRATEIKIVANVNGGAGHRKLIKVSAPAPAIDETCAFGGEYGVAGVVLDKRRDCLADRSRTYRALSEYTIAQAFADGRRLRILQLICNVSIFALEVTGTRGVPVRTED